MIGCGRDDAKKALRAIYHKAHSQTDRVRERLKTKRRRLSAKGTAGTMEPRGTTNNAWHRLSAGQYGNHRFRPRRPYRAKRGRPNRRVLSAKSIAECTITQHEFTIDGKKPL
ncbi:hypothetical protein AWB66_02524 [Caballeronia telluris]|uniref:Uncharacterized protein n=1 Tax=Caballeronia telluris TaxID=326475 RepID=A0A158HP32_9BURK|nr:hypothetical protein AWB66_02524 [Caballeronia telluris]